MQPKDLVKIVRAFADSIGDIDLSHGRLLVQVRDELVDARMIQQHGQLWIEENGEKLAAVSWLINRIARLPLLADRIVSFVPEQKIFVAPSGRLLDQPDFQRQPSEDIVADAASTLLGVLGRRPAGTTSIVYITSDAGEGKTTLINHLARQQALLYKQKRSDWLLLPVTLGGRGFLRFDDVVIAALVNRFRFQMLYYDGFIELVKLGVIVPAFDGFEEMFVESSSGEALSALSNLARSLDSSGTVLIAARRAYFEYQDLRSQIRLFDGMSGNSVAFARVSLERWTKAQFLDYMTQRRVANPEQIYEAVSSRFGVNHPILTRAVLVKRLADVASNHVDLELLLEHLGRTPDDYFFQFVNAIIEREANEKWIDRSGEPHVPLLSVSEHHELLSMIAVEMWLASTDALKADVLDIVADLYSDAHKKRPTVARQIRERLKQHSLLVNPDGTKVSFAFDHEDFRQFYLGQAIGLMTSRNDNQELRRALSMAAIPVPTMEAAASHIERNSDDLISSLALVVDICKNEVPSSFAKENASLLALLIAERTEHVHKPFQSLVLPQDALVGRVLKDLSFVDCHFQATGLEGSTLTNCSFRDCVFERLQIPSTWQAENCTLVGGQVRALSRGADNEPVYAPSEIASQLVGAGFALTEKGKSVQAVSQGEDVKIAYRALRIFLRATQINESVIRQHLSTRASHFFNNILPALLEAGVIEIVPYRGAGTQRRFRLAAQLSVVQSALTSCDGSFDDFIEKIRAGG